MQNFLSGRKKATGSKLPDNVVVPSAENSQIQSVEVISKGGNEPKVELITQNGQIEKIIVTCNCGQRVELKCHY